MFNIIIATFFLIVAGFKANDYAVAHPEHKDLIHFAVFTIFIFVNLLCAIWFKLHEILEAKK